MEKVKIYCYKAMAYDNYSQDEGETIFFTTKKQAINYVKFMEQNDPNTKGGYTTYTIAKQVVYLSEYAMIINYLKHKIRGLEEDLEEIENDNGYYEGYYTENDKLEYERKIKETEQLLAYYQEKLSSETNEKNYQQNTEIEL